MLTNRYGHISDIYRDYCEQINATRIEMEKLRDYHCNNIKPESTQQLAFSEHFDFGKIASITDKTQTAIVYASWLNVVSGAQLGYLRVIYIIIEHELEKMHAAHNRKQQIKRDTESEKTEEKLRKMKINQHYSYFEEYRAIERVLEDIKQDFDVMNAAQLEEQVKYIKENIKLLDAIIQRSIEIQNNIYSYMSYINANVSNFPGLLRWNGMYELYLASCKHVDMLNTKIVELRNRKDGFAKMVGSIGRKITQVATISKKIENLAHVVQAAIVDANKINGSFSMHSGVLYVISKITVYIQTKEKFVQETTQLA